MLVEVSRGPYGISFNRGAYLFCGVHATTVCNPAVNFEELALIREGKLMADGASCYIHPPFGLKVSVNPVFRDVSVVLDLVRVPIVGGDLYSQERKRD